MTIAQNAAPTEKKVTALEATRKVITAGIRCSVFSVITENEFTIVGSNAKPLAARSNSLGV